MSSLVEQLQADALNQSVAISNLLRKAKATAVKLHRNDLSEWIERELGGYPSGIEVPDYRTLHGELKFFNPVRGWCPIVGFQPEVRCWQPVSEIASLVERPNKGGVLVISVSPEIVQHFSNEIGFTVDVRQHVSVSSYVGVIDAVRNAVLDWALRLEQAGVRGEGMSFSPGDTDRARHVTVYIGGNAVGLNFGDQSTITATQTIVAADLAGAVREFLEKIEGKLADAGLTPEMREQATAAVAELQSAATTATPDVGRLRRGLDSLRGVMEHAAGHVVGAGILALIAQVRAAF